MIRSTMGVDRLVLCFGACAMFFGCSGANDAPATTEPLTEPGSFVLEAPSLPEFRLPKRNGAGETFRHYWNNGLAEMNGYRLQTPRYGEIRTGELVLIYVTEPHDRRTWVKDDRVTGNDRVDVLKVNAQAQFQTGVYPYSVLTSTFAPVDDFGVARFQPTKITMSVQEWCGHTFKGIWPSKTRFLEQGFSYFAGEGHTVDEVSTPVNSLYEDGLLIQLRELDGPFADGADFTGLIVPALWQTRVQHRDLAPVAGRITRERAEFEGQPVNRFTLRYGEGSQQYERVFDVEVEYPHRILKWTTSTGEVATLIRTARQAYWGLHDNADEGRRREFLGPDR